MLTPGDGVSMPRRSRLGLGLGWSFVVAVKPEGERGLIYFFTPNVGSISAGRGRQKSAKSSL
ncbi:hypothetical protein ABIE16_003140 [Pseudomonas sp. 2725]|jgi:hypothetical protein